MSSYLFIDGGYLRERYGYQMEKFYGFVPPIKFAEIASQLGGLRTYYYDAVNENIGKLESETDFKARIEKTKAQHAYINSLSGFHVRLGHVRRNTDKNKQEQKGVDVMLTVDALEHAARGNMQVAMLLAGDLDFEPLVASLVRFGVRTRLFCVPQNVAPELQKAADDVEILTLRHFHGWAVSSFQINYPSLGFQPNHAKPSTPYVIEREGTWKQRKVFCSQCLRRTCRFSG